jgi:SAM-dependent methyltransferase
MCNSTCSILERRLSFRTVSIFQGSPGIGNQRISRYLCCYIIREGQAMAEFDKPDHWDVAARHYEKTAHPFTARYAASALARVALTPLAAQTGARVLATDFSPGMVERIAVAGLPNVEARVMDGQALDLDDASFDAVFSIFGVIMFPDWRKGLAEMARVTRPGGYGVVASWQSQGADREGMTMPQAVLALSEPADFASELVAAGYHDPRIETVTHDYELDVSALEEPDTLFGMSPDWTSLNSAEKAAVIAEVRKMAGGRAILPIPSTALISVSQR